MIPGVISLVRAIPAPWALVAIAALTAGAWLAGNIHGHRAEGDHRDAQQMAAERLAEAVREDRRKRVDRLALDLERARAERRVVYRTITQEVDRYVEVTPAADRCTLPGTWRLRHDLAATGQAAADAARVAAGAAGPVDDAAALATIADNYADCREWREQLVGWQRWWGEVSR